MRVVVAPDKFKGTLGAPDVAAALARGWRRADRHAEVEEVPVADGGEGTLEALVAALGGEIVRARVTGPLGDPVNADYGLADHGGLGVVEMARGSGLSLVRPPRRDVRRATTFGTGELILAACRAGARRVVVGVGGSATNDAGAGMAQAAGVRLLDAAGRDLPPGGAALRALATIDLGGLDRAVRDVDVMVAADVDSPLVGPRGASAVYGPQKGASEEDVVELDEALGHFAAVVHRDVGIDLRTLPGGGAAGGLAAGLVAFLGARIRPGFDVVADAVRLAERLDGADIVVTGEGRWDPQSVRGKAPAGVLRMAGEAGCRTVVVAGDIVEDRPGADLVYSLVERAGREAAFDRTRALLEEVGEDAAREAMS
jgi:glycerate kinase